MFSKGSVFSRPGAAFRQLARAVGVVLLVGACSPPRHLDQEGQPELAARSTGAPRAILVVVIDTLRADRLGAYGAVRRTSPFVDSLGEGGLILDSVWAPAPWTVPSVASMLTGLPPSAHGAGVSGETRLLGRDPVTLLNPSLETLPGVLAAAGWRTVLLSANPYLHGPFSAAFSEATISRVSAGDLVDTALASLHQPSDASGALLWVQFMDAHQPTRPPAPYFNLFRAGTGPRLPAHADWSHGQQEDLSSEPFIEFRAHRLAAYDGAIRYVDDNLRLLVEGFEERYGPESLVIITSDHGEEFWDHSGEQAHRIDDPRGIWGIGHGHSLYDEQLRVPFVASGAGVRRGRDACPHSLVSLARSVLESARVAVPDSMWGPSLFSGQDGAGRCPSRFRWAEGTAYGADRWALEVDGHKLVAGGGLPALLFDLVVDPLERKNLADELPETRARLEAIGSRVRERSGLMGKSSGPLLEVDEELRRELVALGYL